MLTILGCDAQKGTRKAPEKDGEGQRPTSKQRRFYLNNFNLKQI